MSQSRRSFIKSAGVVAIASVIPSFPFVADARQLSSSNRRSRIAIFYDQNFPEGEITGLTKESLASALKSFDVSFLNSSDLDQNLKSTDHDLYINPYGSLFPKSAWKSISGYLNDGGNWLNLGGVPFSVPADKEGDGWRKETSQSQFHKKLGITQAFPVKRGKLKAISPDDLREYSAEEIYELYVRFTVLKDFPAEDGSGGARDAALAAIGILEDEEKRMIAAPFIQIDRLQGEFAGGRWVLANFKGTLAPKVVAALAERAMEGATEFTIRSSFACYVEGESPSFTINLRRPKGLVENYIADECHIEIVSNQGRAVLSRSVRLRGKGTLATGYLSAGKKAAGIFTPGFYQVHAIMAGTSKETLHKSKFHHATGFWKYDEDLMKRGSALTVDADYFQKDGNPYPVVGTTYMGSDVHRKFLFEPNPMVWREDFGAMKKAGINMVRTGIWTGWKNIMLDVGSPDEGALRAMDAFIHTARSADIPVIFTFFAFLPETWGGLNAYLDPRSVNAQKEFILSFVHRYQNVRDLIWDFINEPSFCNPQHLWQCRPNYDGFESAAWKRWLTERYTFGSEAERLSHLQEMYRTTAEDVYGLPKLEEFADVNIFNENRPIKVIDYRLFAQEMFKRWTKEMADLVRQNGNPGQLLTVGQDEGGTGESPSNQFFAEVVDFTSVHNWWLNDDLLWDSVVTKTAAKPNLVEETGVMFYEKMDGRAWRTEDEARDLLERKLAIAFGSGSAGVIEWVWNTNPYMMSDNEAAIGLHRADGTAKPEREPLERFARFVTKHKEHFVGKRENECLMIIPHAVQFSTRNFATEATKRCIRVISHFHSIPVTAASEYTLSSVTTRPKLIFAPSMRALSEEAWKGVLEFVENGSTLLLTGIFDTDEHFLPTKRGTSLGLNLTTRPVTQEEFLSFSGKEYRLSYRGDKMQRLELSIIDGSSPSPQGSHQLQTIRRGKGTILWSPLPVELSDPPQANIDLYDLAVRTSGIVLPFSVEKVNPSMLILPLIFESTVLLTFVSETDRDTEVNIKATESNTSYNIRLQAQRSSMLLFRRNDGKILGQL